MTILAKLLAKYEDTGGYIVYVFECLDKEIIKESPYLMCTRFPNWDHRTIDIGEVGYLNFKERIAGIDKWFDGKDFIPYRYDDIQFIRFIEKPKTSPNKFVILIKIKFLFKKYNMTEISEKLNEAMKAKKNDVKSFVWKLAKKSDRTQEEILLVDATPEQLNTFYKHCLSMLYSKDKNNPGRYPLLDLIKEQKRKCTVELFLRQLDRGTITEGAEPYPRTLWLQDIRAYMAQHRDIFPIDELDSISISQLVGGLKPEYKRITIEEAIDGCLDMLGTINTKHITFNFILNMGIFFTPSELQELEEKDANGKIRSRLEVLKERLRINPAVRLTVKPSGLNYTEFRAMVQLKSTKYSLLSTDQLTILEKKILPRLEKEIDYHISQWNERINQIRKVAEYKGITLEEPDIA